MKEPFASRMCCQWIFLRKDPLMIVKVQHVDDQSACALVPDIPDRDLCRYGFPKPTFKRLQESYKLMVFHSLQLS